MRVCALALVAHLEQPYPSLSTASPSGGSRTCAGCVQHSWKLSVELECSNFPGCPTHPIKVTRACKRMLSRKISSQLGTRLVRVAWGRAQHAKIDARARPQIAVSVTRDNTHSCAYAPSRSWRTWSSRTRASQLLRVSGGSRTSARCVQHSWKWSVELECSKFPGCPTHPIKVTGACKRMLSRKICSQLGRRVVRVGTWRGRPAEIDARARPQIAVSVTRDNTHSCAYAPSRSWRTWSSRTRASQLLRLLGAPARLRGVCNTVGNGRWN